MVPAQEMAKSTVEKAAICDRIRGELDSYCWSTLASCSEAVQHAVFTDLNNAISNPKWQLTNLPGWTVKSIHRHMPRVPRNANETTKVTRCAHALLHTMSSNLFESLSYRCDLPDSM